MSPDIFDPIAEQEGGIVRGMDEKVRSLETRIRMIKAMLVLRSSPGWKEYADTIKANLEGVIRKALAEATEKREYWSGYSRGMSFVVQIMDAGEAELVRLESTLSEVRKTQNMHVTRQGRVVPGGI